MDKVFLTGITGLVGSAFVVASLRDHEPRHFVCLVRHGGGMSAAERVEKIIRDECAFDGCPELADFVLEHISVIDGDIVSMDPAAMAKDPAVQGVNKIFHCAADVNLGKDPTGKVFRINYDGTMNMLALAKLLKIQEFHYVATAYVAGKLVGRAMEDTPKDSGFNNPYEESKFKAEMQVRASGIPFTVYRPAIVTGRASDGRIRKPLAFYRILEFLGKLKSHHCKKDGVSPEDWYNMKINFSTEPSEHVYFVPIDYVQKAITELFELPATDRTYHVTGNCPVTTRQIEDVVCEVLRLDGVSVGENCKGVNQDGELMRRFIGDLFPYFSSDIIFDQTNITAAMGEKFVNSKYGVEGLETLIRAFYRDYFPNVEWLQNLMKAPIERKHHRE